nr:RNA polymerase pre-readthrough protein [Pelargonium leaf curl virus]
MEGLKAESTTTVGINCNFQQTVMTETGDKLMFGSLPSVLNRPVAKRNYYRTLSNWVLTYTKTGKIEDTHDNAWSYVEDLVKTDFNAKYDWLAKRGVAREYRTAVGLAIIPGIPAIVANTRIVTGTCEVARAAVKLPKVLNILSRFTHVSVKVPYFYPRVDISARGVLIGLAAAAALVPICAGIAYATLPREKLSVFRLKTEVRVHMEDEKEATDLLLVEPARELKGKDGEDLLTGSRLTKVIASTRRPRRRPYAAKIAQVARAKVGYLKNSPENRLIYQRVMIEIMDKDCVRYVDRDVILPLAIGCCFVYPDGVEESAALWGSQESLGVK